MLYAILAHSDSISTFFNPCNTNCLTLNLLFIYAFGNSATSPRRLYMAFISSFPISSLNFLIPASSLFIKIARPLSLFELVHLFLYIQILQSYTAPY